MNANRSTTARPPVGATMLGRFSTTWGLLILPLYLVLFAGLLSGRGLDRLPDSAVILPSLIPWVGIGIGAVGSGIGWMFGQRAPTICLVGIALNFVPLVLAMIDQLTRLGDPLGLISRIGL